MSWGTSSHTVARASALGTHSFLLLSALIKIIYSDDSSTLHRPTTRDGHCLHESFQLFDGYEYTFDSTQNGKNYFHFNVDNLYQCLTLCRENSKCKGINFHGYTCQQIEHRSVLGGKLTLSDNTATSFSIYAEKICIIDARNRCQGRPWVFEHVLGYHLTYPESGSMNANYAFKQVSGVGSAEDCGQLCLEESQFECLSATYNSTDRLCVLAHMNRYTIDTTYSERVEPLLRRTQKMHFLKTSPFSNSIHYLENKCINEPNKFCDLRQIGNSRLKTVDSVRRGVQSQGECRELCLSSSTNMPCKSFDFVLHSKECRLSHLSELSTLHLIEPYRFEQKATTYEISTCYNVSIFCEPKHMKIQIQTNKLFNGKIYAKSQPKQCSNDVSGQLNFGILMPYSNSSNSSFNCDTRQPVPGHFANDIIIQHHDLVLTTKDLALGVYCKFDLENDNIARIDLKIQGDIITEKLKETAKFPELSLHIVDHQGRDIEEVAVGDMLRVQIRLSDDDTYGIFVRNLVAKDYNNASNSFTLIDNRGCPVEVKMMREMRTLNEDSKSLESYLEVFTFTGGSLLVIQAEVETCLDKCKPVQCQVATGRSEDIPEVVTSYGRRRRSASPALDSAETGDVLSMTMLSKSLLIRSARNHTLATDKLLGHQSWSLPLASVMPRQLGTPPPKAHKNLIKPKNGKQREGPVLRHASTSPTPSIIINESHKSSLASSPPYLRISIADKDFICFDLFNLAVLFVFLFCTQALVFSLVFHILLRNKVARTKDIRIKDKSANQLYFSRTPYNCMY